MSTYTFGVATTLDGRTGWLVQNASKNNQAQEALALDNEGEPVVAHYYQKVEEMTFEVIIPDGDSYFPEIGKTFKFNNKYYYISAVQITETNTDFKRFTLTCKRFTKKGMPSHSI